MTKRNANSLDELIENFREIFKSDKVEIDEVKELMSKFKSKSYEWRDYAHFDQVKYTRNLIDTGYGKYNLILICWSPGQGTRIHDHSNSHCFMKILTGSLKETSFEWPEKTSTANDLDPDDIHEMVKKGESIYKSEEVAYINDSIGLHRIENPSHVEPAVSLHLYAPPIKYCKTFDERTGKTDEVKCGFYSEYGKKVHPSAIPDIKTFSTDNLITPPLSQVKESEGFLTFRG